MFFWVFSCDQASSISSRSLRGVLEDDIIVAEVKAAEPGRIISIGGDGFIGADVLVIERIGHAGAVKGYVVAAGEAEVDEITVAGRINGCIINLVIGVESDCELPLSDGQFAFIGNIVVAGHIATRIALERCIINDLST